MNRFCQNLKQSLVVPCVFKQCSNNCDAWDVAALTAAGVCFGCVL